jgi:hypothetical protein
MDRNLSRVLVSELNSESNDSDEDSVLRREIVDDNDLETDFLFRDSYFDDRDLGKKQFGNDNFCYFF